MSSSEVWQVKEGLLPGYFSKEREREYQKLDGQFGVGRWRVIWRLANGEIQDYLTHFYQNFVGGYVLHFVQNPQQAEFLTREFSYAYDDTLISKEEAFDPEAYFNRPGYVNQIHHVGLNIALERFLGMPFRGSEPIQVRGGSRGSHPDTWPAGHWWHPGAIQTPRPDLIPDVKVQKEWTWNHGSIEHMYQHAKVIQVRS